MKEIQTKRIKNKNLSNDQPYLKENEIGLLEMKNNNGNENFNDLTVDYT